MRSGTGADRVAHKPRILIVDDDREIARGLDLRFRAAGFETNMAHDGQAGLEAAAEWQPDVMILDIRMPVMDGMTVLARMQAADTTRKIPVIVLSASVVDRARCKTLDLGARCFVEKPFDARQLVQAVQTVLEEARLGSDLDSDSELIETRNG